MKLVRRGAQALLFVMALLASLVVSSGTASATSAYDDTVRITQQLAVKSNSFAAVDVSASYTGLIQENCSSGYYDSLVATVSAEGEYVISKFEHGTGDSPVNALNNVVIVTWSENSSGSLGFQTEFSTYRSLYFVGSSASYKSAQIYMDSEGNLDVQCMNGRQTSPVSTNKPGVAGWDVTVWLNTFNIAYPSGYEGVIPSNTPPPAKYVAMGDSFSSGEGVSPFEVGTDTSSNKCHRSQLAYPRLLQNDAALSLGTTAFVACSGAKTSNVLHGGLADGAWGENPQIDALSLDTEDVTISIGGNDVGFEAFATACTIGSCDFATTAYSDIHGKIVNDLPGKLADVYGAIDGATSSTANIYVVGYSQIAPVEMPTGPNSACYPFNGGTDNPDPELNDGATAYAVVSELNSVIEDAVAAMGSTKFHFVDPNLSGSPFIGHDWCQQDRYFVQIGVPIPPSNTEYSFHPNVDGQEAYRTIVGGEID